MPLLIRVPGTGMKIVNEPVGLIDLYPTLAGLCGLKIPTHLDGRSMEPLLSASLDKTNPEWRHSVMTIYGRGNVSLRSDRFRYIRYADSSEELYDMRQDPNEWDNLCFPSIKPGYKVVIDDFRKRIPPSFQHWSPYSYANINPWFDADIEASRKVTGTKLLTRYQNEENSPSPHCRSSAPPTSHKYKDTRHPRFPTPTTVEAQASELVFIDCAFRRG